MNDLWREADVGLFCLSPYACNATGEEIGMIEVVGDAETLANIIFTLVKPTSHAQNSVEKSMARKML
ncbi:hypothetical protein PsorP6_008021 [Peronosclerospora sorghi]|uniref:Uncharacterized protein n=1 Tax=Peronosclerospora sorghi TaxID=230839 RepID=A0ACC0WCE1_9STRA|nr:hypothetical protein PsorP6_008021 [Peronosclerospora sorghi]